MYPAAGENRRAGRARAGGAKAKVAAAEVAGEFGEVWRWAFEGFGLGVIVWRELELVE